MPKKKKEEYKQWLKKIFNINSISIAIIILVLILGTFFNLSDFFKSIGLSMEHLIELALFCFLMLYASISYELHELEKKISILKDNEIIEIDTLSNAIKMAIGSKRKIKKLRIFALSTNLIQPFVRDALVASDSEIEKCFLLIRDFADDCEIFWEEMKNIARRWKEDPHIKKIQIARFPDILSDFCILVDNEIAILGAYIFTDKDSSHVTNKNVILVHASRSVGKSIIEEYIQRFDNSFEYFCKNQGKHSGISE